MIRLLSTLILFIGLLGQEMGASNLTHIDELYVKVKLKGNDVDNLDLEVLQENLTKLLNEWNIPATSTNSDYRFPRLLVSVRSDSGSNEVWFFGIQLSIYDKCLSKVVMVYRTESFHGGGLSVQYNERRSYVLETLAEQVEEFKKDWKLTH